MEFIVRYKIDENKKEEAAAVRHDFFASLNETPDPQLSYRSLRLADGVSFVHLAWFRNEEAKKRFFANPGFKKFSEGLGSVAVEGPEAMEMTEVAATF